MHINMKSTKHHKRKLPIIVEEFVEHNRKFEKKNHNEIKNKFKNKKNSKIKKENSVRQ